LQVRIDKRTIKKNFKTKIFINKSNIYPPEVFEKNKKFKN